MYTDNIFEFFYSPDRCRDLKKKHSYIIKISNFIENLDLFFDEFYLFLYYIFILFS